MLNELYDAETMEELYYVKKENRTRNIFEKIQMHFIIEKMIRYLAKGEKTIEVTFLSELNKIELEKKGYTVDTLSRGHYDFETYYEISIKKNIPEKQEENKYESKE